MPLVTSLDGYRHQFTDPMAMTSHIRFWLAALSLSALSVLPQAILAQQRGGVATGPQSGFWIVLTPTAQDTIVQRFTFRFERDSVVGANPGGAPLHGSLRGDSVRFSFVRPDNGAHVAFAGVFRGDTLRGTRTETPQGASVPTVTRAFLATPDPPSRAPRRLTFEPQVFHRVFSGAVPPALRIMPGDTVRTWTVDNAGRDSTGKAITPGGNPLTGPFFIEGALPGDVIAIRLHRVRLNRDWADSWYEMVSNALTPGYVRQMKVVPGFNHRWQLDRARGVAVLEKPTPALQSFAVPLRPMLGCLGVAPWGGQAIQAQDSGPFGGNMDYNAIREGATVYLPVFQRGALLFMGDGHAVQGDGELTGDAIETSLNIEFSVELLRGHRIREPRAEDDEFRMAIGISGNLDDALRQATTELARWLESDFQLSASEVASVLGTRMRYDVAEVVGSQVSIVAKIPKVVLDQLVRTTAR